MSARVQACTLSNPCVSTQQEAPPPRAGGIVILTAEEFDARGADAVVDALNRFHDNEFDEAVARSYSDTEYAAFLKDHRTVHVTRFASGDMELSVLTLFVSELLAFNVSVACQRG